MSDVFISYARSTAVMSLRIAEALRALGFKVWRDDELPVHRAYADVIEEHLRAAKAVVVLWSSDAVKSQWVRAEADLARGAGTLVQLSLDGGLPPLPFNQIQCVDMAGWDGDLGAAGWRKVVASVAALVGAHAGAIPASPTDKARSAVGARETLLAVLAFDNLSNDADLAYFSDGVSEEILYTVARAKGLRVLGKASSFQFRGRDKVAGMIGASLGATHLLDGSVRRAGNRVRINVELVETATLQSLWSERYDRALTDIFALQDEIAAAVAAALDHHFAPAHSALPVDPIAYDLYLQARAILAEDMTWPDQAKCAALLEKAVSHAPDFAQAWGRLAIYRKGDAAVAAAMRGLELNRNCPVALAALAVTKPSFAQHTEKFELALRGYGLAPEDELVSGIYMAILLSLGLLTRACEVAFARYDSDPLSPQAASTRALTCRYAGRNAEAAALADDAIAKFPASEYPKFVRGAIAIFDGDLDTAAAVAATVSASAEVKALLPPIMFMRAMAAMDPSSRAEQVRNFLNRQAPKSFLLDIALASAVGEATIAMDHLLETIDAGRPLSFTANNDGRDPVGATVSVGLFMPLAKTLRTEVRFAEVCVRLGLYECWTNIGQWPDCLEELAPFYDLKRECEAVAGRVGPSLARLDA